jgi:hypothetical protein
VGDQGLIIGGLGSGHREFRFSVCCPADAIDPNRTSLLSPPTDEQLHSHAGCREPFRLKSI